MTNRRLAIVAGLGVVELWIVGLMFRSTIGAHRGADFAAPPEPFPYSVRPGAGRSSRSLETGPAPQVLIDDDDATLTVRVRAGSSVGVTDETQHSGWVHGETRPLTFEKTADGVRIARSGDGVVIGFGSLRRRLDVVVPPDARLDVRNAGPTAVAGLRAAVSIHTDDGSISLSDQRGAVTIKTDNARVELHDVDAPSVDVGSDNGRVILDRVRAASVAISTDNGRIDVSRSLLRGGKIQTDSGRIRLALDPASDVMVSARAASGKVSVEPPLSVVGSGGDDPASMIRLGGGSGRLEVVSDDGSITVAAAGGV